MSIDINSMLDSFPEGWRPEPGDKLIGAVIGLDSRDGEYGGTRSSACALTTVRISPSTRITR